MTVAVRSSSNDAGRCQVRTSKRKFDHSNPDDKAIVQVVPEVGPANESTPYHRKCVVTLPLGALGFSSQEFRRLPRMFGGLRAMPSKRQWHLNAAC